MGKLRTYYEQLFASYPDVVTLPEFCKMLGGIGDSTARKLMRENRVLYPVHLFHPQILGD